MRTLRDFARDERAATAIEYGLITAGICIAIITAVNMLGTQLSSTFSIITSDLASAGK
jgi:pilus assembly protein Flp/PilA